MAAVTTTTKDQIESCAENRQFPFWKHELSKTESPKQNSDSTNYFFAIRSTAKRFSATWFAYHPILLACCLTIASSNLGIAAQPIKFDVNRTIPAAIVESDKPNSRLIESKVVEFELEFSVFRDPQFTGNLDEVVFMMRSRRPEVQVFDYWPRTSLTSSSTGPIEISEDHKRDKSAEIKGAAAYPGIGQIDGAASYTDNFAQTRVYQIKPEMELLSASGSIDRRTGVYFKFRKSPHHTLEGDHLVRIQMEVPQQWRGDSLIVSMQSFGSVSANQSRHTNPTSLGKANLSVAVFQENDSVAAKVSHGLLQYEQLLLDTALAHRDEIDRRSYNTPLHRMGASLDLVKPAIPSDWLQNIIFSQRSAYPTDELSRLPIDVRVAILDYLDQRSAVDSLAGSPSRTERPFSQLTSTGR